MLCSIAPQWSSRVVHCDLSYCSLIGDLGMASLATYCFQLQVVLLRGCDRLTDVTTDNLAKFCCQLRVLDLSYCYKLTDQALASLAAHARSLEILRVDYCLALTCEGFRQLARGCCVGLDELSLQHCTLVEDLATLPGVSSVDVSGCRLLGERAPVTAWGGGLHSFIANYCTNLSHEGVAALASSCRALQQLYLDGCQRVCDESVGLVARGCPDLRCIGLCLARAITDGALHHLAAHCPRLELLGVARCGGVTDIGVTAVARGCPQLDTLHGDGNTGISDASLLALAAHCPRLEVLMLAECPLVTSAGVWALTRATKLSALDLRHCPNVNISELGHFCTAAGITLQLDNGSTLPIEPPPLQL